MSNTGLPFGLCKRYHIPLPDNATPKDAWEALQKNGITYFEEEESTVLNPASFLGNDDFDDREHLTTLPTILLPKREHTRVLSIISQKIAGKGIESGTVMVRTGNYRYIAEVYGFGNYRIIVKQPLK